MPNNNPPNPHGAHPDPLLPNVSQRKKSALNIDILKDLEFPNWYYVVKWFVPIATAFALGFYIWLALTGVVGVSPDIFGRLAWAPVVFSNLDKIQAAGMLFLSACVLPTSIGVYLHFMISGMLAPYVTVKHAEAIQTVKVQESENLESHQEIKEIVGYIQENHEVLQKKYEALREAYILQAAQMGALIEKVEALTVLSEKLVLQSNEQRRITEGIHGSMTHVSNNVLEIEKRTKAPVLAMFERAVSRTDSDNPFPAPVGTELGGASSFKLNPATSTQVASSSGSSPKF